MRYLLVPFQLGDPNDAFAMNPRDTDAPSCLANSASLNGQKNPDPHEKAGGSKCFVSLHRPAAPLRHLVLTRY
jgi:hypothetical protein